MGELTLPYTQRTVDKLNKQMYNEIESEVTNDNNKFNNRTKTTNFNRRF